MNKRININEYDKDIRRIAWKLCGMDLFLAEELRSEMYISILSSKGIKSKAFYLKEAKCRAIDYLRSRLRNYSYSGVFKHISLEAMEESGFQIDTEGHLYAPNELSTKYITDDTNEESQ